MISLNYVKRIKEIQDKEERNEYAEYKQEFDKLVKTIQDMHDDLYAYAEMVSYIKEKKVKLRFMDGLDIGKDDQRLLYLIRTHELNFRDDLTGKEKSILPLTLSISFDQDDKEVSIWKQANPGDDSDPRVRQKNLDTLEEFIQCAHRQFSELEKAVKEKMYEFDIPENDQEEERDY